MRHSYKKIGPRLAECARCGTIKQTTRSGAVYRKRASAPWQDEEPECRDPRQPTLYEARPDDADDDRSPPLLLHDRAPHRVPDRDRDMAPAAPDRAALVEAIVNRRARSADDAAESAQDPVALALSIFPGARIVEDAAPVDFGGFHVQLHFDEEKQWLLYGHEPNGVRVGIAVHFEGTRGEALSTAERYVRRMSPREGNRVRLVAGDEDHSWTCVERKWRKDY